MSVKEILENHLKDVKYMHWVFSVIMDGDRPYLQIGFLEPDTTSANSSMKWQRSRKWILSPHMTKSEVVQTAFKAVLTAVEHETREKFLYREKPIFGPHFNVDLLQQLCDKGDDALDVRKK